MDSEPADKVLDELKAKHGLAGAPGSANTPQHKDGYCWCEMCGFNARLPAKYRAQVEDEHRCQCCDEVGMLTFLCVADKLPQHVAPDSPMETYSPNGELQRPAE